MRRGRWGRWAVNGSEHTGDQNSGRGMNSCLKFLLNPVVCSKNIGAKGFLSGSVNHKIEKNGNMV